MANGTICPTACADFDLTSIASALCDISERTNCVRAVGFYKCDVVLPSPLTDNSIKQLMTGTTPALVFSSPISDGVFADPATATRQIADCLPETEFVVSREFTFKDKIQVNVDSTGAPAPFEDYKFWKNKKDNASRLNICFVMCDGSLVVPREKNSNNGLAASFSVSLGYEKADQKCYEFKSGKIKFLADPLDFTEPQINLNDIPEVAGLW